MTNAVIAPADKKAKSLADLYLWWLILAFFAAAALLLPARRANAQETAGPLPAAVPSDQPPPSPRATAPAQIGGKPNLSGTWALNKDESDDPREAMQQQSGNSGGHGGGGHIGVGGGMGGGGWGGGGQRGGGGSGGGGRRGGQGGSGDAMNNLSQLTIEQTASSAKVTGDSSDVLALYSAADSSKTASSPAPSSGASSSSGSSTSGGSNASSGDSASASSGAQWQGTQLVAVTPGRREGSKTTRTYELSPDGKQLYVTTKMESPRFKKPVTFRFVYDPAQSGG